MSMTAHQSLGDAVRAGRTNAGLSQRQLGEKVSLSVPFLSDVERGFRRPSAATTGRIAKALDLDAGQLLILAGHAPLADIATLCRLVLASDTGNEMTTRAGAVLRWVAEQMGKRSAS